NAWAFLPGSALKWTGVILGTLVFPLLTELLKLLSGPPQGQPLRMFLLGALEDVGTAIAQIVLQIAFLVYQSYRMIHAVAVTLVRLAFTRRSMLEWETAASVAARA